MERIGKAFADNQRPSTEDLFRSHTRSETMDERIRERLKIVFAKYLPKLSTAAIMATVFNGLPGCVLYNIDGAISVAYKPKIENQEEHPNGPWEDMPSYQEMQDILREYQGHSVGYPERIRTPHHEQKVHLSGYAQFFGIEDEQAGRIIQRSYPHSWIASGSVNRIEFVSDLQSHRRSFSGTEDLVGGYSKAFRTGEHAVQIQDDMRIDDRIMQSVLDHEVTHANDWHTSNVLTDEERTTLQYAVTNRVLAEDRIRFPYTESYLSNGKSAKDAPMEYLAMITQLALNIEASDEAEWISKFLSYSATQTKNGTTLPGVRDLQLVTWYLQLHDPEFRPWDVARTRNEALLEFKRHRFLELMKKELDTSLHHPGIRAFLLEEATRPLEDIEYVTHEGRELSVHAFMKRYASVLRIQPDQFNDQSNIWYAMQKRWVSYAENWIHEKAFSEADGIRDGDECVGIRHDFADVLNIFFRIKTASHWTLQPMDLSRLPSDVQNVFSKFCQKANGIHDQSMNVLLQKMMRHSEGYRTLPLGVSVSTERLHAFRKRFEQEQRVPDEEEEMRAFLLEQKVIFHSSDGVKTSE